MTYFYAIPTNIGLLRIAQAHSSGVPLQLSQISVGDGNGSPVTPLESRTALVRERFRVSFDGALHRIYAQTSVPGQFIAECWIEKADGGFYGREIGLHDQDGVMIYYGSCPPVYFIGPSDNGVYGGGLAKVAIQAKSSSDIAVVNDPSAIVSTQQWVQGYAYSKSQADELFGMGLRYYPAGASLPTADRGPIWSADYNSLMTWQSFTANGANYVGYASQLIGSLLMDTQPTPRAGYVASGAASLARAGQYAALRAWGQHHGLKVASGVWAAGTIAIADNPDGTTFRVFDVRGEFPRFWDDGRGVDPDRIFGSWMSDSLRAHSHSLPTDSNPIGGNRQSLRGSDNGDEALSDTDRTGEVGGSETRPRSTAFLASIKF